MQKLREDAERKRATHAQRSNPLAKRNYSRKITLSLIYILQNIKRFKSNPRTKNDK